MHLTLWRRKKTDFDTALSGIPGVETMYPLFLAAVKKEHLSFVVGVNYTYVVSQVDMRESLITSGGITKTEKQIREENARVGQTIGNFRPMYGQSPYIINAFATFKNDSLGLIFNTSYNVQGKKLAAIGIGRIPDVYEQPFHSLNFKVSKSFGADGAWQASLTSKNLLLSTRRRLYESFNATSQVYSYFNPGMTITAGVSYNLIGKKDKKKGWYIYYWTFDNIHAEAMVNRMKQERINNLKKRLEIETSTTYYSCKKKCIRMPYERALENNYLNPIDKYAKNYDFTFTSIDTVKVFGGERTSAIHIINRGVSFGSFVRVSEIKGKPYHFKITSKGKREAEKLLERQIEADINGR